MNPQNTNRPGNETGERIGAIKRGCIQTKIASGKSLNFASSLRLPTRLLKWDTGYKSLQNLSRPRAVKPH